MPDQGSNLPNVLVIGDVHVDVVLAPFRRMRSHTDLNWLQARQYRPYRRAGGAWLLKEIITAAAEGEALVSSYGSADQVVAALAPDCPVSLALLDLFPRDDSDESDETKVYRLRSDVASGWLNFEHADERKRSGDHEKHLQTLLSSLPVPGLPQLIVLHDHNNGFRDLPLEDSLYRFTRKNPHFDPEGAGLILWHTDGPLGKGPLWEALCGPCADRVVAVVNEEDLREVGLLFRDDLSIEQTAVDFLSLLTHPLLADLARCAYLAVRFSNGMMLYGRRIPARGQEASFTISYLPSGKRATALVGKENGLMIGYTLLLVGALARALAWTFRDGVSQPAYARDVRLQALRWGAELGICYAQKHYREGFLPEDFLKPVDKTEEALYMPPYPYVTLIDSFKDVAIYENGKELLVATVPFDPPTPAATAQWSRVSLFGSGQTLEEAAADVVKRGFKKVVESDDMPPDAPDWVVRRRLHCPYYEVGDLLLIDRNEIDDFESIGALLASYLRSPDWEQPLSLAVFGPPGSGKSFSVKQLFKSAARTPEQRSVEPLEFNLAQFRTFEDLATAFHQVQDKGLDAGVPLVIFDEFDTAYGNEALGWLKYFLAPMQDGKFRHGETTYRVGRAIFVFAGGIHSTFSGFYDQERSKDKAFRNAKGPDFVSRLRGHLNISGVDSPSEDVTDILVMRRAILLHTFLKLHRPAVMRDGEANIDKGVIRAFLRTRRYEHGVRSMEAIIQMAAITARDGFQKSSVPHPGQLKMHVDAEEFLRYVHSV